MATRRFCDLCGKLAEEQRTIEIFHAFGPEREDEEYNKHRTQIRVSVNFGFRDHPSGFGGPPDLCGVCLLNLVNEVKKHAERNAKP